MPPVNDVGTETPCLNENHNTTYTTKEYDTSLDNDLKISSKCSVCLEIVNLTRMRLLPGCGHTFCEECVNKCATVREIHAKIPTHSKNHMEKESQTEFVQTHVQKRNVVTCPLCRHPSIWSTSINLHLIISIFQPSTETK